MFIKWPYILFIVLFTSSSFSSIFLYWREKSCSPFEIQTSHQRFHQEVFLRLNKIMSYHTRRQSYCDNPGGKTDIEMHKPFTGEIRWEKICSILTFWGNKSSHCEPLLQPDMLESPKIPEISVLGNLPPRFYFCTDSIYFLKVKQNLFLHITKQV